MDYYEFIAISDNEPVRRWTAKRAKPASKTNLWRPKLVTYEERTLLYYIWQVGRLGVVFFFLALSSAYLEKYPFQSQTRKLQFLMPWDITGILEAVALGTKCMSILDLAYTIGTLPIVHLVKAPYIPVLDSPYLSTSLRDFWSNRWNQPIKITIHRIAFAPTLKYLEDINGGIDRRRFNVMVATLSAFVWSSLLHEYVCAMLVHEHWIPGEQSVFFLLHGIGCILVEVCGVNQFTKRFGSFMGNMLGWLGKFSLCSACHQTFIISY
ncbi:hypothetical protein BCR33DRAFT_169687 [Rhizoclosmatium globosum]|uniref:Wax synthase domain-containing protein n=1 Tax=Rhizoclosmatium globosum TaxID=329046 RepID=A0A1Y2CF49_9FUNG|nr:hypothetical protein BCR33DRAFT_169687 [Rhizoclosmatium globosum]|eukprot:ORY45527.1 hypothetical protein BCR33DRAFT_169687 [Rhizoclosmatium globosum]